MNELVGTPGISIQQNLTELSRRFNMAGRLQIPNFLAPVAAALLLEELRMRDDWVHVVSAGLRTYESPAHKFDAMPIAQRAALDVALFAEARTGFRFRYDAIRVPEVPIDASMDCLAGFAALMNERDTLDRLCAIAGCAPLRFADAQATRYRQGDFLTRHDDNVAGKDRVLAYVLSVSPNWRPEWGGLLLFNGADGAVSQVMVPTFNTLCLFTVPQPHSVSYVAPYAGAPRLSVTGWLRSSRPF